MTTRVDRRRDDKWHVGKEVPLALIFALFAQTAGWIWWAATQSAKLDTALVMINDLRGSQYTQSDARRDKELVMTQYNDLARRVEINERLIRGRADVK